MSGRSKWTTLLRSRVSKPLPPVGVQSGFAGNDGLSAGFFGQFDDKTSSAAK
jgi:hypothetical protein